MTNSKQTSALSDRNKIIEMQLNDKAQLTAAIHSLLGPAEEQADHTSDLGCDAEYIYEAIREAHRIIAQHGVKLK